MKAACLILLAGAWAAATAFGSALDEKVDLQPANPSKSKTPVAAPREFDIKHQGGAEPVVYSESSGEEPNVIDRPTIEKLCSASIGADGARYSPTFDDGFDRLIKFRTWRFTNKQRWANYTATDWYVCEEQGKKRSSVEAMCHCHYRVVTKYHAQIKTTTLAELQITDIDFSKKEARRSRTRSNGRLEGNVANGQAVMSQFAPQFVGNKVVAGIPCVVRRRSLGGDSHVDLCISEDADKKLAPELRYRTLSEYMPRPDGKGVYRSSQTDKIVLDGVVDPGVFSIPDGFSIKELN